jgi:hypothetical protein
MSSGGGKGSSVVKRASLFRHGCCLDKSYTADQPGRPFAWMPEGSL